MEQFYTIKDLQSLLKLSRLSLYRYIKKWELKTHKLGKNHRISEKDLQEFLDKNKN